MPKDEFMTEKDSDGSEEGSGGRLIDGALNAYDTYKTAKSIKDFIEGKNKKEEEEEGEDSDEADSESKEAEEESPDADVENSDGPSRTIKDSQENGTDDSLDAKSDSASDSGNKPKADEKTEKKESAEGKNADITAAETSDAGAKSKDSNIKSNSGAENKVNATPAKGVEAEAGVAGAGETAAGGAAASGATGGATAAGSATAGGTAAAGGAAAGGAAVAGGATVGAPVLIGIGIAVALLLVVVFIGTIYSYATPKNIVAIVGKAANTLRYNIEDTTYNIVKEFWYFINPFEDSPTSDSSLKDANVPIPKPNVNYDENSPQDMALLEEYKLIQVAFSRAYDNALKVLEKKCEECGYDYEKTLENLEQKYPKGWQDVYKTVNYGEFITAMYFYMHDDTDLWGTSSAEIQEMLNDYKNAREEGSTETYTFSGKMLGKIESLLFNYDNSLKLFQMGYVIVTDDDAKYLDIEIKPYNWNQLYEIIGCTPEGYYEEESKITYSSMMELMVKNLRAINEDRFGNPKLMYHTLQLDNNFTEWETSFESNNIFDLYALYSSPEANEYNEEIVYIMLRSEGFTPSQAAGICGSVKLLNLYNTGRNEDRGTIGICNWDIETEADKLFEFAESIDADPYSIYTQAAYLVATMRQDGTEEKIKKITGTRDVVDTFTIQYEKHKSFSSKKKWEEAKNGIEWENYTYSKIDKKYHVSLKLYRDCAADAYTDYSGLPIMFWPAPKNDEILEDYGLSYNSQGTSTEHKGIDIKCNLNDEIVASACGKVKRAQHSATEGNFVVIEHNGLYETRYLHLDSIVVKEGDLVLAGQTIGYAGQSGNTSTPHLHFGVRKLNDKGKYKYVTPWEVVDEGISYMQVVREIISVAQSAIGEIPYYWGGKATKPGHDNRWKTGEKGLDCSGFVQWVYWTTTGNNLSGLSSTGNITNTQTEITREELKIGDLGVKFKGWSNTATNKINHVGIYAGKNDKGEDIWIHCVGGDIGTVVCNNYSGFTVFYRVNLGE